MDEYPTDINCERDGSHVVAGFTERANPPYKLTCQACGAVLTYGELLPGLYGYAESGDDVIP